MKKIFVIDWALCFAFVLSALSGIGFYIAGYGSNHDVWHYWAVAHVATSALFLAFTMFHVTTHWGWYRQVVRNGIGRKSRVTVVLSILFSAVSATGLALLGVEGANSTIGQWHSTIGFFVTVLSVGHILKRIPALRKSLKKNE